MIPMSFGALLTWFTCRNKLKTGPRLRDYHSYQAQNERQKLFHEIN